MAEGAGRSYRYSDACAQRSVAIFTQHRRGARRRPVCTHSIQTRKLYLIALLQSIALKEARLRAQGEGKSVGETIKTSGGWVL
jgi:hypothetical protein